MNLHRITTDSTVWVFDFDRMVYLRIPRNEFPEHPMGGKPYEGREVEFIEVTLGRFDSTDGMQQFRVFNKDVEWGKGAVTVSWSIPGEDWTWLEETSWKTNAQ